MATLINGVSYAWVDINLVLFGVPVTGITKIMYKKKQNKENLYGAGAKPTSRGYANEEYEASIEIYSEVMRRIIDAAPNKDLLQIPPFDIPVVYGSTRTAPVKDVIKMVEFTESGIDSNQGDTSIKVTLPLIVGDVFFNA
jgi:hypothetical protein